MIISKTPLRISFLGGGSDLPAYYAQAPGAVVSTAINKYIYITVNRKFDHRIRASYSVTEIVEDIGELKHELIRESLRLLDIAGQIEITSISDIPSRGTGLGSSSAYTVGLLNALHAYRSRHAGAERLAREACHIEIDVCGHPIGKQDQYIAAYGGLQTIRFHGDETVTVDPVICSHQTRETLQEHLLMLYTGRVRSASGILATQSRNTRDDPEKRRGLGKLVALAERGLEALTANDLDAFGELLHRGWLEKKKLADGITTPEIDDWYDRARRAGALGGKVLGAGGGGFLLLYAPPEHHARIGHALPELVPVDVSLEPQGSKIIFVEE